jgi:acyl-CoA thioesterase-1
MTDAPPCDPHLDFVRFEYGLRHLKQSLYRQRKIKIVAIGSSSVAGEGDVIPFPPRLELALRKRYPDRMIDVFNRGVGGQEAPEELSRFQTDVIDEAPTLVIWQVGTNAIYHRDLYDPHRVAGTIATGLSWLKALEMDVILMDLQYAPILVNDPKKNPDTVPMVSLISSVARTSEVNLFPRFELMKRWQTGDKIDPMKLFNADGLHQTDFATSCIATAFDLAIGTAVGPVPGAPPPAA